MTSKILSLQDEHLTHWAGCKRYLDYQYGCHGSKCSTFPSLQLVVMAVEIQLLHCLKLTTSSSICIYLSLRQWRGNFQDCENCTLHIVRHEFSLSPFGLFLFFCLFLTQITGEKQAEKSVSRCYFTILSPSSPWRGETPPCSHLHSCLSVEPSAETRPPQWEPLKQKSLRL